MTLSKVVGELHLWDNTHGLPGLIVILSTSSFGTLCTSFKKRTGAAPNSFVKRFCTKFSLFETAEGVHSRGY